MTVSVRLVRVEDDEVLTARTFRYESSKTRRFVKWGEKGGLLFKEELDRCFRDLAEKIVAGLFVN